MDAHILRAASRSRLRLARGLLEGLASRWLRLLGCADRLCAILRLPRILRLQGFLGLRGFLRLQGSLGLWGFLRLQILYLQGFLWLHRLHRLRRQHRLRGYNCRQRGVRAVRGMRFRARGRFVEFLDGAP